MSGALLACVIGTGLMPGLATPASAANRAPRITRATVVDFDNDQAADAIQLRYSKKIRHARDADGRYPFRVEGFKIRAIKATKGTQRLIILLKPHVSSDIGKAPVISYNRTRKQPVRDMSGKQAANQSFKKTIALAAPASTPTKKLVSVTVSGPGYITSTPEGIYCPPTCSALFDVGAIVTLDAHPSESIERAAFESWSGACTGTAPSCMLTISTDVATAATFVQQPAEEEEVEEGDGVIILEPLPESPLPESPLPAPTLL